MVTKSIYANGSKGHHKFTLNVQEDSTSTSENQSLLSFNFVISASNSTWQWRSYNNITYSITIGTETYTGTIPNFNGNTTTIRSVSNIEITHNSDGTKTIPISFAVTDPNSVNYTCGNASESSTMTLTSLHEPPRITNVSIEELSINNINNNDYVNYLSSKRYTITATTSDGATIQEYRVINGDYAEVSTTSNIITMNFNNKQIYTETRDGVTTPIIKIKLTDDKGGISYTELTNQVFIDYAFPTIIATSTTVKRNGQSSGKVKLNLQGNFTNKTIGEQANYVIIDFKYWQKDRENEPQQTYNIPNNSITISNNNISITNWEMEKLGQEITDVNKDYAYFFKFIITDAFGKTNNVTVLCTSGEYLMCKFKNRVDFKKITQQNKDLQLLPISLFHSNNGTNDNITLNDDPTKYSYLELLGADNNGVKGVYVKIANPTDQDIIHINIIEAGSTSTYIRRTQYRIDGNTLKKANAGYVRIVGSNVSSTLDDNYIYITDVLGYM